MNRVRKIILFVIVILLSVTAVLLLNFVVSVRICQATLRNVFYNNLRQYQLDHQGCWPTDVVSVAAAFPGMGCTTSDMETLLCRVTCPAKKRKKKSDGTGQILADYYYVNWSLYFGTNEPPDGFPLFYDKSLANHWGLGVNVMTTDGRVLWDFGGRWLKKFAKTNSSYVVPLPN